MVPESAAGDAQFFVKTTDLAPTDANSIVKTTQFASGDAQFIVKTTESAPTDANSIVKTTE